MHNFGRFDAKFLIQAVRKRHGDIRVLPTNMERFLSFSLENVVFIDSYNFLSASLEQLAKDVLTDEGDWNHVYEAVKDTPKLAEYVKKKLPFPYSYFDSLEKLKVKDIPSIEEFYDVLKDQPCPQNKYDEISELWSKLGSFKAVHDLYVKTDTLLLCDIFEKFRKEGLKNFRIDPAHYISLPSFSWDTALLFCDETLELIDDESIYSMLESNCRGGICQVS